jgi:pentatricopeptide repeat protein
LVKTIASKMPKSSHSDLNLLTSLLDALMKCGDVNGAELVFDKLPSKTQTMYGAMIKGTIVHTSPASSHSMALFAGYVKNELPNEAIRLFNEVRKPNEVIVMLLFNACAQLTSPEALDTVRAVSSAMPRSFHADPNLVTSLLDALMKCGDLRSAERLFTDIKSKKHSMYGAMITGSVLPSYPHHPHASLYRLREEQPFGTSDPIIRTGQRSE